MAGATLSNPSPIVTYEPDHFKLENPKPLQCDLVMKGGITSGIVYPYAILKIATQYRLRSLGGTSAGAIAAALAAAAEYARLRGDPGGFVRLQRYCDELPEKLQSLFQPSPQYRVIWAIIMKVLESQARRKKQANKDHHHDGGGSDLLRLLVLPALIAGGVGAGVGLVASMAGWITGPLAYPLAVLGGASIGALGLGVIAPLLLVRSALNNLEATNYGLCTGLSQDKQQDGITDWIERALNDIAFGEQDPGRPLLFGDLISAAAPKGLEIPVFNRREPTKIDLQMVTTNLSAGRPHTLPDPKFNIWYSPAEWSRLFPKRTLDWLQHHPGKSPDSNVEVGSEIPEDILQLPYAAGLPVIVAVRMSLSFPVLFETVPIYAVQISPNLRPPSTSRADDSAALHQGTDPEPSVSRLDPTTQVAFGHEPELSEKYDEDRAINAPKALKRYLLSDGGISSNFPTTMFDSPLPRRPTFGFNLLSLPPKSAEAALRVVLPMKAGSGFYFQSSPITNLVAFASSILNAAKDWQDKLQTELTGQRERTVNIYLSSDEGGLNLAMPPALSRRLMQLGDEAGACFVEGGTFDFDEHRWRRALASFKGMTEYLDTAADGWKEGEYDAFLRAVNPQNVQSYRPLAKHPNAEVIREWFAAVLSTAQQMPGLAGLSEEGRRWLPRRSGKIGSKPKF